METQQFFLYVWNSKDFLTIVYVYFKWIAVSVQYVSSAPVIYMLNYDLKKLMKKEQRCFLLKFYINMTIQFQVLTIDIYKSIVYAKIQLAKIPPFASWRAAKHKKHSKLSTLIINKIPVILYLIYISMDEETR